MSLAPFLNIECRCSLFYLLASTSLLFCQKENFESAAATIFLKISAANFKYPKRPNGLTIWAIMRVCMDDVLYVLRSKAPPELT